MFFRNDKQYYITYAVEINDINRIAYTDVRFIDNINSSISLKDNACEENACEREGTIARGERVRERER